MAEVIVIGAGLAGPLLALNLQKRGYQVSVYERYLDVRSIPSSGRSINLVLTSRGLKAVRNIDQDGSLLEEMLRLTVPVTGRIIHHLDGAQDFQRYGKDDSEFNYSISRYELNKFMISKAAETGVRFFFDHTLEKTSLEDDMLRLHFTTPTGSFSKLCQGPVIGADGGGSRLRYSLRDLGVLDFAEEKCPQGYKEMHMPEGSGLEQHGLHIWPRGTHFLMGLANRDGSFTGTIYIDKEGPEAFESLTTRDQITTFFNKYYSEAIPALGGMEYIIKEMKENRVGYLGTLRTTQFNFRGKAVLLGDAAHAITPFFGQGTNASFEDVYILTQMMMKFAPPHRMTRPGLAAAFSGYNSLRKSNSDAIADMALENFVEMRSKVADRKFLLKKKVQNILENKFEAVFRSRYAMVCYGSGNVSYANAKSVGDVQWEIIDELCESIKVAEEVDLDRALQLINSSLVPLQKMLRMDLRNVTHSHLAKL